MTQSWKTLTSIQIGGALCLPVLAVGQQLAVRVGFGSAVVAIMFGNAVLCAMGLLVGVFGARHKLSTIECAERFLGGRMTYAVACAVVISCLGWFALQLGIMVEPFVPVLGPVLTAAAIGVLGLLITASSLKGVAAIGALADYAAPLFALTLGIALFNAGSLTHIDMPVLRIEPLLIVIALALAAIVDLPTFFRFAKSERDARISVIMVCMGALPAIEIVGAYLGTLAGGADIAHALIGNGGTVWYSWIVVFLILAGWTTNNANIYSASVSLRYIIPTLSEYRAIALLGALGTVVAVTIPCGAFCSIIEIIALPIVPIGLLTAYAALREMVPFLPPIREYDALAVVFSALGMGIVHGLLGITLTGYLLTDTALMALGMLIACSTYNARRIVA